MLIYIEHQHAVYGLDKHLKRHHGRPAAARTVRAGATVAAAFVSILGIVGAVARILRAIRSARAARAVYSGTDCVSLSLNTLTRSTVICLQKLTVSR
jgi:hypothetical protein